MEGPPWRKFVFRGTLFIGALALISLVALVQDSLGRYQQSLGAARASARTEASRSAGRIDSQLRSLMPQVEHLAADLSSGKLEEAELWDRLRAALEASPESFEVGVAYEPYARSPAVRLYAPHVARVNGEVTEFQLEQRYDYTQYDWYRQPIDRGKACWGEPYFGKATQTLVVGYSVPFYRPGEPRGAPLGVVRINLAMENIRQMVSSLDFLQTGYGFLLSARGVFLASPAEDDVRKQLTFADFAREHESQEYRQFGERALRGERVEMLVRSTSMGREMWMVSEPIAVSGWSLGAVFFPDEIAPDPVEARRSFIRMMGSAMLVVVLVILAFCHRHVLRFWHAVAATSLLLIAGISLIWWVTLHLPTREGEEGRPILKASSLKKYLEGLDSQRAEEGIATQVQIPTRVQIQGLWSLGASSVDITGYVWQRYPVSSKLAHEIDLPEAGTLKVREISRRKEGEMEEVGWFFEARLRQSSDSAYKYPFDSAPVRLCLRHRDSDRGVVLVPDLKAYPSLAPSSMPGVKHGLKVPGWSLERSFFSYVNEGDQESKGLMLARQPESSQLCLNLGMQRQFLDPFIAAILPIVVVSCLLFLLLMVGTKNKALVAATGFRATDILRACISLLFPVIFAQINMRTKVAVSGLIYLEYLYFVMYLAILLTTINALTFTMKDHGLAQLQDNLVPKLLFWPLLLGAFFAVTLLFLY